MQDITFTNVLGVPETYLPKPASKYIPDWYKDIQSYSSGKKEILSNSKIPTTIKKCMPVFDSMTAGYILFTPFDVFVTQEPSEKNPSEFQPFYHWKGGNFIEFHDLEQLPNYPNNTGHTVAVPKFINPWAIKTPKGYSILIVQPQHRESVFNILPGIVDTDKYTATINFPFVLKDIKFSGLIPAGTPMAQIIPFKRDSWKMKIGNKKEIKQSTNNLNTIASVFFDGYKTLFRSKKEFL